MCRSPFLYLVAAITTLVLFRLTPSHAADTETRDQIRAQLNEAYDRVCKATQARDFKTIRDIMTDDFVSVDAQGNKSTRDESIAARQRALGKMENVDTSCRIQRVTIGDGEIEVSVQNHFEATYRDEKGVHRLVSDNMSRDLWVRSRQGLKIRRSETTDKGQSTLDGQPI